MNSRIDAPRIVALVPMRHESQRVPGKNYRVFNGRPLYHWIVRSLLGCPLISQVVIDTDSPFIMEDGNKHFPEVRILARPEQLRGETVAMNEVLLHDTSKIAADYYLQTHSTNPLLKEQTISRAIALFLENRAVYDSLFSVTRVQVRLWSRQASPINHNPRELLRTQDLPPVFEENSCLYIFSQNILKKRRNRIGEKPLMFEIERAEAWDIDEELDFQIAEFLCKRGMVEGDAK